MRRVQRADLLVGHGRELREELHEVGAHVGVGAVEEREVRYLRERLQHRLHDVGRRARDGGHDAVRGGLGNEGGVDVHHVQGVGGAPRLLEVGLVRRALRGLGQGAPDVPLRHAVHAHARVPRVVEDGAHVLAHEVHAKNADVLEPALLHHLHRTVRHHQGVADEDVRPLLRRRHEHPLHLGVHVEVRHDPDALLPAHSDQLVHQRLVGLQVLGLGLSKRPLGGDVVRTDHQGGEAGARVSWHEQARTLLCALEHVVEAVSTGRGEHGRAKAEALDERGIHLEDLIRGHPGECLDQHGAQTL
mmetsp:Transcript_69225/g.219018  ORF Transcript_69225/g.219018 Transcript_69225/m.219018 type:complete len:302 (+) Transcript_69225:2732-3637(+)